MRTIKTTAVVVGPFIGWLPLAVFANRNHIDFSAVAFPSSAAILAFLLPGVAMVGPYIKEELQSSSEQARELSKAAKTARTEANTAAKTATSEPEEPQPGASNAAEAEAKAAEAEAAYTALNAATKQELNKIFMWAAWLRAGLVYAFLAVPVAAAALVIGPGDQSCWDWRAIVGSAAVALLVATGIGIVPITWRLLGLKTYRMWAHQAFP